MADLISMLAACAGGGEKDPYFNQTVLLLHGDGTNGAQNNTFLDSSTNNFTITRNPATGPNAPTQGTFSPFSRSSGNLVNAPYDPAVHGGSGYFDGSGDFLSSPNNSAIHVLGSDFCLEGWFYLTAAQGNYGLYSTYNVSPDGGYLVRLDTSIIRFFYFTGSGSITIDRSFTFTQGQWYHFAVTVSSGTGRIFINGAQQGATFTVSATANSTTTLQIGRTHTLTNDFPGYLSNFRVVKGSAVYTSDFTPTGPLTAITNTSLLLNFTNAGIFDNTGKNNLETVGNAQIDTTTKKFGTGSMEFDGTGDYLIPRGDANNFVFGSGDFTIEFWVYPTSVSSSVAVIYDSRPASTQGLYPVIYLNNATIKYFVNSADRITGSSLSINTWYYIAITRSGTSTKMFVNGTQSGSTYTDSSAYINGTARPAIGASGFNLGLDAFTGFIDDLRITKGVARTITVPTAAFPNE